MVILSSFTLSLIIFKFHPSSFYLTLLAISLLGTLDDILDIRALYRLPLQFIISLPILFSGWNFPFLPHNLLSYAFALIFLVGVINTINCWDVSDGAGGATAIAIFLSLALYSRLIGEDAFFPLLISGAVLGWLPYNIHPAKIFLGDGGSYLLGLATAGVALKLSSHLQPALGFAVLFPFFFPCLDFLLVHYRRWREGTKGIRAILKSKGKDHLPHRLLAKGYSPNLTALILFSLVFLSTLFSLPVFISSYFLPLSLLLFLILFIIVDISLPLKQNERNE
ncbi:MAG: MraY family glycosyltransferase [bacterium]